MSANKPNIDPTETYILESDDEVDDAGTLELTDLVHRLTADLLVGFEPDENERDDEDENED